MANDNTSPKKTETVAKAGSKAKAPAKAPAKASVKASKPAGSTQSKPTSKSAAPKVSPPAKAQSPAPAKKAKPVKRKPSAPRKISGETPMAAAKKDTAKETFETVTLVSNEAFKEGFEKSLTAVNDFSAFQKDTVDAVIASATTATKSIEELNASTMAFAKKSMEDGVAAAKSMAGAKSVQDLIELQADYTKSTLDAYLAEVNKNTDLVSAMVKETFKPINERVSAAVEAMQSHR